MSASILPDRHAGASLLEMPVNAVHEPDSVESCADLLRSWRERNGKLGFRGGGTALGLGNPPRALDAVVSTRKLDRVVEYAPEDQVAVVEAGLTLGRLQALARERGQWLGVDAPHAERATIGGLVAVGGFGPRRARYGAIRDLLLGVTLVRADGAVARGGGKVVKNVAGFDLPKVVAGSLGTLGLIATVTLRLHPLPEASVSLVASELTADEVGKYVLALRRAQLEPSSNVAVQSRAGSFDLGVRLEGFGRGVERDAARLLALGWSEAGGNAQRPWQKLDESAAVGFWRRAEAPRVEGTLRARITALPTRLTEMEAALAPLLATLRDARFVWYASLGIGFVAGAPEARDATLAAVETARQAAVRGGGSLVIDRAPDALYPALDAWGPTPGAFAVMKELKQRFDPESRLNPGRFIGGI